MQTSESLKREKIHHLESCLEKLQYKDNGFNEDKVLYLYEILYNTIVEMLKLEGMEALKYFDSTITDDIRKALLTLNIELVV